eukprot:10160885-Lingulodinium_polyedra.AAC.1
MDHANWLRAARPPSISPIARCARAPSTRNCRAPRSSRPASPGRGDPAWNARGRSRRAARA